MDRLWSRYGVCSVELLILGYCSVVAVARPTLLVAVSSSIVVKYDDVYYVLFVK